MCYDAIITADRFCTTYAVSQERNAFYTLFLQCPSFPIRRSPSAPSTSSHTILQLGCTVSCTCCTTGAHSKPFLLSEVPGHRSAAELLLKSYHRKKPTAEAVKPCMPAFALICLFINKRWAGGCGLMLWTAPRPECGSHLRVSNQFCPPSSLWDTRAVAVRD